MPMLLWDASALAKRYAPEIGSDTTDALFSIIPAAQMVVTFLGYAETYSILLRKHNRGAISTPTFRAAKSYLRSEIIDSIEFNLLAVDETAILDGITLMERHNINASDSAILAAYLHYASPPLPKGLSCVLIASDQRLLRAAQAEGLRTLNPETLPAADVAAFLASL